MKHTEQKARERAGVILQVRSGQISAKEGARRMGVSRKTYYQWEKRALEAMMAGLEEQAPGRPRKEANPELEAMQQKIAKLEAQLKAAEQTAEVRAILMDMRKIQEKRDLKKKKPKSPRS
jgi:transposase